MESFYTPEMIAALAFILIVQSLSLLLLLVNFRIFRSQARKYHALLSRFGDETGWGSPGRILMPVYIVLTMVLSVSVVVLFIWQPHFF
ncbi:MAG: hypothetical protein AAB489_04250 [Patescibacteria group bacterium]